jgi:hypothetical protein
MPRLLLYQFSGDPKGPPAKVFDPMLQLLQRGGSPSLQFIVELPPQPSGLNIARWLRSSVFGISVPKSRSPRRC